NRVEQEERGMVSIGSSSRAATALATVLALASSLRAQPQASLSQAAVADQVNQKMVKLFGTGGFRGITAYGTGVVISPDGFVLTAATPMLDTSEILIHLYDGRRLSAKV